MSLRSPSSDASDTHSAALGRTAAKALFADETQRTRIFVGFALAIVVLGGIATFVFGGDPVARYVHLTGLCVAGGATIWFGFVAGR